MAILDRHDPCISANMETGNNRLLRPPRGESRPPPGSGRGSHCREDIITIHPPRRQRLDNPLAFPLRQEIIPGMLQ